MKRPCDNCGKDFEKTGRDCKLCDKCWEEVMHKKKNDSKR